MGQPKSSEGGNFHIFVRIIILKEPCLSEQGSKLIKRFSLRFELACRKVFLMLGQKRMVKGKVARYTSSVGIILHLESSWGPWVASTCPCDGSLRVKTRTCHPGGSHQHNCTGLHELIVPCQSSHCKSFIQFLFFGIHVILIILIFLNHSPNPVINFFPQIYATVVFEFLIG